MEDNNYPDLQLPKEHILLTTKYQGQNTVMPHSWFSLVHLEDGSFGVLVKKDSQAQHMMEEPVFAVNIVFHQAHVLLEQRPYTFDELHITPLDTSIRNIPAVSDAIVAIESEPVQSMEAGEYTLYICEMLHIQKIPKQTLQKKLKRIGIHLDVASTYS